MLKDRAKSDILKHGSRKTRTDPLLCKEGNGEVEASSTP